MLIADLVEAVPLPENPNTELRRCLLAVHQLMDIQLVKQPHQLPQLATQKLSPRCGASAPRSPDQRPFQLLVSQLFGAWTF